VGIERTTTASCVEIECQANTGTSVHHHLQHSLGFNHVYREVLAQVFNGGFAIVSGSISI
jgi:hypothetical protein